MKEFRLEVKLKNNLLVQRRLDSGLTLRQVAEGVGLRYDTYLGYETLRIFPLRTNLKDWKPTALKIAAFWDVEPGKLWPGVVLAVEKRGGSFALGSTEARLLVSDYSTRMLETPDKFLEAKETAALLQEKMCTQLDDKEREIIEARFGLDGEEATLEEVSQSFGVSRTRIRQIEVKALRKLRHSPCRKRDFLDYDNTDYYRRQDKKRREEEEEARCKRREELIAWALSQRS